MGNSVIIGRGSSSVHGREIVTGQALYVADIEVPGMLIGKALYASRPHARILNIDTEAAKSLPGVAAVLTHKDVPGENSYLYEDDDQPVLVSDRIRFRGDVVAIVAAENEAIAEAALKKIVIDIEPLPGVFDPLLAIKSESPRLWKERDNIYKSLEIEFGDTSVGFEQADFIVENTYQTPYHEHAYLETEGTTVIPENDNSLVVYSSTQYPFSDRRQIARSLDLPEERVRVITPHIGGAFGGKDEVHVQIFAALLAKVTGRPVQMVRTREESILIHVKRHPFVIRYRSGVTADGKLTAIDVEMVADTGPYSNSGATVIVLAANCISGPYAIPNAHIQGFAVNTNNPTCGAMRGFGMPQAHFACERQMDALAKITGIDHLEFRRINGLKKGMKLITGVNLLDQNGMMDSLNKVAEISNWGEKTDKMRKPSPGLRRGWGIAASLVTFLYPQDTKDDAGVTVDVRPDGSVLVITGAADFGQGIHSALAHMAADTLGTKLGAVQVMQPDTSQALDAGSSVAARQTFVSGNALLNATGKIKNTLLEIAQEETGISIDLLELHNGFLYAEGEILQIRFSDLTKQAAEKELPLCVDGYYLVKFPKDTFDPDSFPMANGSFTFGAQVAQVLVDIKTGQVKVENLWIAVDAGRIIHFDGAIGQIEGGAAMGLGQVMMEELKVEEGRIINDSLDTYLIPTSMDMPPMSIELLEVPHPEGPFGAKGIGEAAVLPVAPAVVNAVCQAIDRSINFYPVTAEKVFEILKK